MENVVTVVVVDDHPLIREAIRSLLSGREDIGVVGEGGVGDDVLPLMAEYEPDILLLDLSMLQSKNAQNGTNFYASPVIKDIRQRWPETGIIILTQQNVPALIHQSIKWGVAGYILKGDDLSLQLPTAIDMVRKGAVYFSESVSQLLYRENKEERGVTLTPKQMEALTLMYRHPDDSNQQHARTLGIKDGTYRSHLSSAYKALGVTNDTAAIIRCLELGFFANRPQA